MGLPIVAIVGPTASGKTRLSVALCQRIPGEVISMDSMQIYRGMDVGTAKPTQDERGGVAHHLPCDLRPPRSNRAARLAAGHARH